MSNRKISKSKLFEYTIYLLLVILLIYVICCVAISKKENKPTFIFNLGYSIVVTDSMTPEINVNDLIIYKKYDFNSLKIGDDIIFKRVLTEPTDKFVVHRIVKINYGENQEIVSVETSGIKTGASIDEEKIYKENYAGLKIASSAFFGKVIIFLYNPFNWLFVIFFCAIIKIIIYEIKKIIKINKENYKNK